MSGCLHIFNVTKRASIIPMKNEPIYIRDPNSNRQAWTGEIRYPTSSAETFKFEAIRPNGITDLYCTTPFEMNAGDLNVVNCIEGLLDFQRPCTLVRPLIVSVNPGSLGTSVHGLRTVVKGSFSALVTGESVSDADRPIFKELSFSSASLAAWAKAVEVEEDELEAGKKYSLKYSAPNTRRYRLDGIGVAELSTSFSRSWTQSSRSIKARPLFTLRFTKLMSLNMIMKIAGELETLFSFLVGHPTEFPDFTLKAGRGSRSRYAILTLSGVHHKPTDESLDKDRCIHFEGCDRATLGVILRNFFLNREDFIERIMTINYSTHFAKTVNDAFSSTVPILEIYLKRRFKNTEEAQLHNLKEEFFSFIEREAKEELREFSRKHIKFVKEKPRGLLQYIEEAITYLNERGWKIPTKMARNIRDRRGAAFHGTWSLKGDDFYKFHWENKIARAILLFLTLEELGIDIEKAAKRYPVISEFNLLIQHNDSAFR